MGSISSDVLLDRRAKLRTSLDNHQNALQQIAQQRAALDNHERQVYANLNAVQGALALVDDLIATLPPAEPSSGQAVGLGPDGKTWVNVNPDGSPTLPFPTPPAEQPLDAPAEQPLDAPAPRLPADETPT